MTTDFDNTPGPASDDDAMPSGEALSTALGAIFEALNPGASAAPGQPNAEPPVATRPMRPASSYGSRPAPNVASRGGQRPITGLSIAQQIEALERHDAWADAAHPQHERVIARLTELYQADAPDGSPPLAPMPHPQQVRAQVSRAQTEAAIRKLEEHPAYLDRYHPEHDAVIGELRRLYQQAHPEPVPEELPHVSDLRRATGTQGPKGLPSVYAERWSTDTEAEFLHLGMKAGIRGDVLQAALNFYVQTGLLGGAFDRGFTKEHEEAFFESSPSMGLTDAQAKGIVAWFRSVQRDAR